MKKTSVITSLLLLLLCILSTSTIKAQRYKTALGVRLSSNDAIVNNSISLKYFFSASTAVEGLLSFGDPLAIGILIEKHKPVSVAGLSWFYGVGGYVGFGDNKNIGAQGVLGLDYKLAAIPLNLSLDWKPELNLIKEVIFEPSAIGVSIRFTFN